MQIHEFHFLVNVCVLIFVTKTLHQRLTKKKKKKKKKKEEEEIDANMWFPLSCQRSHPIMMSSIVRKMRCLFFDSQRRVSFRDTTEYFIPSTYFFYVSVFVIYPTLSWLQK